MCEEYTKLSSEGNPVSHVSVGTSDHFFDEVSDCKFSPSLHL